MSLSIMYVVKMNSHCCLREDFIHFAVAPSTTGDNLKKLIVKESQDAGLFLSNLHDQDYDGAWNMSGEFNGLQKLIMDEQTLA